MKKAILLSAILSVTAVSLSGCLTNSGHNDYLVDYAGEEGIVITYKENKYTEWDVQQDATLHCKEYDDNWVGVAFQSFGYEDLKNWRTTEFFCADDIPLN